MEFWCQSLPWPMAGNATPVDVQAARAEEAGWDGTYVTDSQCLSGDVYTGLALAARATSRIQLATGVTNPYTRHASVTAGAISTVNALSNGRAVLGIGRGDSSMAYLGLAPAPLPAFRTHLEQVQAFLSGQPVELDATGVEALGLKDRPEASRITWLDPNLPKVPVEVFASGPKVISLGAQVAERVMLAVGADHARLEWALQTARDAAGDTPVSLGAYFVCVVHPDRDVARRLAVGRLGASTRFSVLHGKTVGPVPEEQRAVFENLHKAYDMKQHGLPDASQGSVFTPEFVEYMAVVGSPDECVTRLREIEALGLDRVYLSRPNARFADPEALVAATLLEQEVLPAMRS